MAKGIEKGKKENKPKLSTKEKQKRKKEMCIRDRSQEERPVDPLRFAVAADGLGHREDVRLVEPDARRRPAMPRGAEGDSLGRDRRIGLLHVIRGQEPRHVHEERRRRRLPRERMSRRHGKWQRPAGAIR